jgi:hypothetical protein
MNRRGPLNRLVELPYSFCWRNTRDLQPAASSGLTRNSCGGGCRYSTMRKVSTCPSVVPFLPVGMID